jgi:hypothetical protein
LRVLVPFSGEQLESFYAQVMFAYMGRLRKYASHSGVPAMPVIKRTVAVHPIMDSYVRKLQAILIEKGWNATYSSALNYMILYNVFDLQYRKIHPKVAEALQSFLVDRKTVREIQREDRMTAYLEQNRKSIRERYIT